MHIEIDYRYLQKLEEYKKYKEESLKDFNSGNTVLYSSGYHKTRLFLKEKEAISLFKRHIEYKDTYEFIRLKKGFTGAVSDLKRRYESAETIFKLISEMKDVGWTIQDIKEEVIKIKSMNLFQRLIYSFKKDTLFNNKRNLIK